MFTIGTSLPGDQLSDNTKDGQCVHCGECCSDAVTLLDTDIARIRRYIQKHNIQEEDHSKVYQIMGAVKERTLDLTCPFLKVEKLSGTNGGQKASCNIYPVRPAVCRAFTCQIASDSKKIENIYDALRKTLTPDDIKKLASSNPKSLRATFFSR